jgi:hypothetical protein
MDDNLPPLPRHDGELGREHESSCAAMSALLFGGNADCTCGAKPKHWFRESTVRLAQHEAYDAGKRAALAAQAAQPVAWCSLTPSGKIAHFDGRPMVMIGPVGNEHHQTPLYATPQPQGDDAPTLTDEQIAGLAHRTAWRYMHSPSPEDVRYEFSPRTLVDFARAVFGAAVHGSQPMPPEPNGKIKVWREDGVVHAELWEWLDGIDNVPDGEHLVYAAAPSPQGEDARDAERFRWLCDDHADAETRARISHILNRISVMSLSAVRAAIDAATKGER